MKYQYQRIAERTLRGRLKRVSCNERIGFSTPLLNERIRVSEIGSDFSNVL
jgi:hypothetical protein